MGKNIDFERNKCHFVEVVLVEISGNVMTVEASVPLVGLDETDPLKQWHKEMLKYLKDIHPNLINPLDKHIDIKSEDWAAQCCKKPEKYKNIVSKNLQFYACKNCGADLGDIK